MLTARRPGPQSSGSRESVDPAPQPLGGLVAAALRPPPLESRPLPGLGAIREPEGGRCECERARAPASRSAPGLCVRFLVFWGERGGVSRAAGSECPVLVGECVCVLVPASPDPSPGSSALLFPSCLLPLRSLPKPQPPVHPRNPTPPAPRPGGRQGQGQAAEGAAASYLLVVSSPSPV